MNVTQKRGGLLALGSLEAGGKRFRLDGGVGGLDYTQGYLARHTSWRWAFAAGRLADGTPVGFNFVEGFNEGAAECNENALWVGDRLYPAGARALRVRHEGAAGPVAGDDGGRRGGPALQPIYVHREEQDLRLVVSHFAQPVGLFEGTVRVGGPDVHAVQRARRHRGPGHALVSGGRGG